MENKEYVRISDNSNTVILFILGVMHISPENEPERQHKVLKI